jgi:exodeoxyribonuclease VII small subunit
MSTTGKDMAEGDVPHEMGFEDALEALEGVVARLESGELSLEDALQAFEHGVALVRGLNERLQAAEERVQILSRGADGAPRLTPADEDDP